MYIYLLKHKKIKFFIHWYIEKNDKNKLVLPLIFKDFDCSVAESVIQTATRYCDLNKTYVHTM